MSESKEVDEDNYNIKTWVIIDGIPDLQDNNDYHTIAQAFEEAAKMVASRGSKKEPCVWVPSEQRSSRHSQETIIDNCALIQFGSEQDANVFRKNYLNIRPLQIFGKSLSVYTQKDIAKYENLPDQYTKLTRDEFQESRNLLWWLLDKEGKESFRDQYVIRYRGPEFHETNVFWMDENQVKTGRTLCYDATELKEDNKSMTDRRVQWSPNGYYLLTTHQRGIQIWGGPDWHSFSKLEHNRVDHMSFSPNETFLITCNAQPYENNNGQKIQPMCKIWDVLTGELIRDVQFKTIGLMIKLRLPGWWPIFKWSHDEEYIAKINSSKGMNAKAKDLDKINIFKVRKKSEDEIKSQNDDSSRFLIEKLGGKSLSVDSLFNLEFSPTDNVLAYTSFAQNNSQAKVTLISIPSKNSLRVQTLGFDVKRCNLYWQSQGRYLAINMAHSQSSSSYLIKSHSIGIMTVKDRNMPFSKTKQLGIVIHFSWEPDGSRFAVIHSITKRVEPNVSIFQVQDTFGSVDQGSSRLKLTLEKRRCNQLYWAPKGGRLVIVNVDPQRRAGGEMEFIDLSKVRNQNDDSQTVKNLLHENITDIQWDPSGRYLITATTQYLDTTSGDDTRYIIWSFQGEKLFTHKIKHFYQILWRPRPKQLSKLTNTDKQRINTHIGQGWDKLFKEQDQEERMATQSKKLKENQMKLKLYNNKINSLQKRSIEILAKREKLRGGQTVNYTTRTISQRLEKWKREYVITKDTMRKILSDEIVDFHKWREQNQ